jgi:surface polysaccharide O-acyltransferase-like enzyme
MRKRIWDIFSFAVFVIFGYAVLHAENRHWMLVSGILALPLGIESIIIGYKRCKSASDEYEERDAQRSLGKAVGMIMFSILAIIIFIYW